MCIDPEKEKRSLVLRHAVPQSNAMKASAGGAYLEASFGKSEAVGGETNGGGPPPARFRAVGIGRAAVTRRRRQRRFERRRGGLVLAQTK